MLLLALFTIESDDDRAFIIELYKQYYRLLFDEAYKVVKNRYDAEDVVQEFIVYICNHIEKFRKLDCCTLPSCLVIYIRRRSINLLKRREMLKRHTIGSMDDNMPKEQLSDQSVMVEERALLTIGIEEIQKAFQQLPESIKDILRFKYLLEMTDKEIAELLDIDKNSVRAYLTRARREVYRICKENGYEL